MPQLEENPRTALVLRGQKSSALVNAALTDLFMLKKPNAKHFARHNAVHPFEDAAPLEFLCQKNDASLFAFGTHSKKRPHDLVIGRLFDHHSAQHTLSHDFTPKARRQRRCAAAACRAAQAPRCALGACGAQRAPPPTKEDLCIIQQGVG